MAQATLYNYFPVSKLKSPATDPAPNPFDKLPIETLQHIAYYIERDIDLGSFRLVCHSTYDSVDGDNGSFWRQRFLLKYEKPCTTLGSSARYKEAYQRRRKVLKRTNMRTFDFGETRLEQECLDILRNLINDSFSGKSKTDNSMAYESVNLSQIRQFILTNNLLNDFCKAVPQKLKRKSQGRIYIKSRFFLTIQAVLAAEVLSLNGHLINDHYDFPTAQMAAYGTKDSHPIFGGCYNLDIDMDFVTQNINFWKYHMVRKQESTLFPAFSSLEEHERPGFWTKQLKYGANTVGKKWKGSYSFVDRRVINNIRDGNAQKFQVYDEFNGETEAGIFQDLEVKVVDGTDGMWPPLFEEILGSEMGHTNRAKTRAQHRSVVPDDAANEEQLTISFKGDGHDHYEDFLVTGKINVLPAQEGIPGWQRLTMMKYFIDQHGFLDENALWAYEGVVLPGGRIIVGRWWSPNEPDEDAYSGPFILWCIDGPGDTA